MLAISKATGCVDSNVDVLPCRIKYTGTTRITKRYWQPKVEPDGTKTAYFRGRRLRGRSVKIPQQYQGLILKSSDKVITQVPPMVQGEDEDEDEEPELPETVKVVEQVGTIAALTVWGHDQLLPSDDALLKGVEEWIGLAEAIHGKI